MAQYGWGLSDQLMKKARQELNEIPDKHKQTIRAVLQQMETRPDIVFRRTDDAFVLRFLRARKFNTFEAFKLYAQYFQYRQTNKALFEKFHAAEYGIKSALSDALPGVLNDTDLYGRRIILLYALNWDIALYSLTAIYRALLLSLEKLIEDEEMQINGFLVVIDWSGFTFKQSTWLKPNMVKLIIQGLQDCFPARFGGVHFTNQPWYIEAAFKVMKPFLKEKTKDKIHMHGNNLSTLHECVHQGVLPAELGGTCSPYNSDTWLNQLIGDDNIGYGEQHIFWPENENKLIRHVQSDTFPQSHTQYDKETVPRSHSLNEDFFLID